MTSLHVSRMALIRITIVGSAVVASTIVVEWQVLREGELNAMRPVFFLLALILQVVSMILILRQASFNNFKFAWFFLDLCLFFCAMFGISLSSISLSVGGMVVALVATIMHWQHNNFDIRTPSMVHNFFFLG